MSSKLVSISLGANICSKDGTFNLDAVKNISRQVGDLVSKRYCVALVVGLGGAARAAIKVSQKYAKGRELDEIKIKATQLNALLLIAALRKNGVRVIPRVLSGLEDAGKIRECAGVFGGIKPGLTSDASAAFLASKLHCPLVIVSTMGAIFEKDPSIAKSNALKSVDKNYLKAILKQKGSHVLDPQTCKILLRMSKGSRAVVVGPRNLVSAIESKTPRGTKILL